MKKVFVCLAIEERDQINGEKNAAILRAKFGKKFGKFLQFTHPANLPGEIRGKGGNITFSGKKCAEVFAKEKFDFSKILVTTLDADNCVGADYFSQMTFAFCTAKDRARKTFQPISLLFGNFWRAPIFNRIVATMSTFWHFIEMAHPRKFGNLAAHAQPLNSLAEIGFWATDTVTEDIRQFWRSLLHFRGNYTIVPVFAPILADALEGKNYFSALKKQFLQHRRWAWGISDLAFFVPRWISNFSKMPFFKSLFYVAKWTEKHFMWATVPILIVLVVPFFHFTGAAEATVFGSNAFFLIRKIYQLALFWFFIAILISLFLLPHPPKIWQKISLFGQWIFTPIATILLGSAPVLSAQIAIAKKKREDFCVTEKFRR